MTRTAVELIASLCEIYGAILMANALVGTVARRTQLPRYLLSAVVGGKLARGLQRLGGLQPEDLGQSLRGLGFIFVGFVLKFAVALADAVSAWNRP